MKSLKLFIVLWFVSFAGFSQNITYMEYFVDTDPGYGNAVSIPFSGSEIAEANFTVPFNGLDNGIHFLYLRAQNQEGDWSMTSVHHILKDVFHSDGAEIDQAEYFIDTDPGYGNGTPVSVSPGESVDIAFDLDVSGLGNGLHMLYIRTRTTDGVWSLTRAHHVLVDIFNLPDAEISEIEYFFNTDPGNGNGTSVPVSPGASVDVAFQADMSGLSPGTHFLYTRAKSSDGTWGTLHQHLVLVDVIENSLTDITTVEYYIDDDPGFGNATPVPVTPSSLQEAAFGVDLAEIEPGIHFITVRAKTENDVWSHCYTSLFLVDVLQIQPENITEVEYFIDDDPGLGNGQNVPVTPSQVIDLDFLVEPGAIDPGIHFLCVRAKDEDGIWSMSYVQPFLYEFMQSEENRNITYLEYFVDEDPGIGSATSVPVTPSPIVELDFNVQPEELESGVHFLHIRGRDEDGIWSLTETHAFLYNFMQDQEDRDITYFEYYIDDDPGYGNAIPVDVTGAPVVELDFVADLETLDPGVHFIVLRGQDEDGVWSLCNVHPFFIGGWGEAANITQLEYFFDEDPGYGTGNIVDIDSAAKVVSLDFNMNLAGIPEGQHLVYTRAKDENGAWSSTMIDTLEVLPPSGEFALRFDGENDYLQAGDFQLPASDMTIEAWINPDNLEGIAEILFAYGDNADIQFRLNSDGSLLYGESANGNWNYVLSEPASILPGRWTHVALSKAGDVCTLYINGNFAAIQQLDNNPVTHTIDFGGRSTVMDRFFDGNIDEVRIWETAKSQQEIMDNLCANFIGNETGIYGLWHFDDGTGSAVASDSGPNGFGAWLYNMNPDPGPDCSWIDHTCNLSPAIDLAITSITSPDDLIWNEKGENTAISVLIKNYGTEDFDGEIDFSFSLDNGSPVEETQSLVIPAGESLMYDLSNQIDLSSIGNHNLEVSIVVSGDEYPENNTMTKSVETVEIFRKVYAYNTWSNQSGLPNGPVVFDLNEPGHVFSLADQSNRQYVAGATWLDEQWFGISNDSIFTLDTITGERSFISLQDNFISALAWDETTGKLFGLSWVSLYEIDPLTGNSNYIGYTGLEGFSAMACTPEGELFALNIEDDQIYQINKETAEATAIGPIGFNAQYEQDLEYDPVNGMMYLTAFNEDVHEGELRTVNTTDGSTTYIGTFRGGMELSGFAIPEQISPPITDNHALHFDGTDDYVSVPDLLCPQTFTLECWVNFEGNMNSSFITLVEFSNDAPWIGISNGRPTIYTAASSQNQLTQGWHHLAFVIGDNYSQIFVDGIQDGSGGTISNISSQPGMGIGYNYGDTHFTGIIDELRLWDYPRTETQINAYLNTELGGGETGLVAYYNFNQGIPGGDNTGITTLYNNASTKDYNGTLNNFTLNGPTSNFVQAGWEMNQLIAEFGADPVSGKAPLLVQFSDLSIGEIDSWYWEFGDGNFSAEQNPSYEYLVPGIYGVSLTISDGNTTNTETKEAFIQVDPVTIYDLQFTTNPGPDGTYPSDFNGQEVSVTGIVTASGYNGQGNAFFISHPDGGPWKSIYIFDGSQGVQMGDEVLVEGFVEEYFGMTEILSPQVTILSNGNPIPSPSVVTTGSLIYPESAEQWESVVVTAMSPEVTQLPNEQGEWYINDGSGECQVDDRIYFYEPSLGEQFAEITGAVDYSFNEYGLNPRMESDIVPFTLEADFTATPVSGFIPLTVEFFDLSEGTPDEWLWDFGDGQTSTVQNPTHVYETFGNFTVTLTISQNTNSDTEIKEDLIEVYQNQNGDWGLQHICLENTPEAELMIRAGDIDNLGFGWPFGFDPFTGQSTPAHDFPWTLDPEDTGGTDRVMVVTSYDGTSVPCGTDGYTNTTSRPDNLPEPVTIDLCQLSQGEITSAALQVFVDDIQPQSFCSEYTVRLNGETFNPLQTIVNRIDQSGPIGRMLTVKIPDELLYLLEGDQLELEIDDFTTGAGDGFAIDFVKLLINNSQLAHSGSINGFVYDATTGDPIEGATVEASFWESGITIADGSYFISEAPAGLVYLECRAAGYQTDYTLINLASGQNLEIDFWLEQSLVADFSGSPLSGTVPLEVQFTDLTSGNPTSWEWSFGDGTSSATQSPVHVYNVPGVYTVSLTVSNGDANDEVTKVNYINVTPSGSGNWLAEYFYDDDPGYGNATPVYGNGDEDVLISFNAPISHLNDGFHTFYLRSRNEDGSWSQTMSRPFLKQYLPEDVSPDIAYLEYFFDSDPGFGQATPIAVDAQSPLEIAVNLPLAELDYGVHILYVRSQDENGRWSIVMQRTFIMGNYPADPLKELVRAEYFIDEDPGQGNGEPVMFDPNNGIHQQQFDADLSGLEWGEHILYMRTMDESGSWSITVAKPFDVEEPPIIAEFSADITAGSVPLMVQFTDETYVSEPDEWLWDFGDGTTSSEQNPQHVYSDPGVYTVSLTATGPEGTDTELKEDFITVYPPLYSLEYFFDEDPGYGNGNGVYAYSSNLGGFDFMIPVDELDDGYHLLFVRVQDTAEVWTQTFSRSILKTHLPLDPNPDIAAMEYFIDDDPGFGQANSQPVSQSPDTEVDALIPLDGIDDGLHNIYARSQDENGRWSETFARPFLKSYVPGDMPDVTRLEYFIDADPGTGNATPVNIPEPQPGVERSFVVNLDGQVPGEHRLFVRAIDSRGHWSIVYNELFEVTASGAVHVVQLPEGWSGISSYVIPDDASVENIFAPVQNELVILQNFEGMYWPTAGVNTLGNWNDHAGYQVKMETAQQVTFSGNMQENLTANLSEGWNYLPVLNACDNDADELFSQIIGNLLIVKEVAGYGVYWPQFGINTLGAVQPGKAYFILVDAEVSLEFSDCQDLKISSGLTGLKGEQTLSEYNIHRAPVSHNIAFPSETCPGLESGDIISIYNQHGICCGAAVFSSENMVITVFGDDPTTPLIDGFVQGEPLTFRTSNPETGKSGVLDVEFDYGMPNGETFANHGLSAVKSLTVNGTGGFTDSRTSISIYPNPSHDVFNIDITGENSRMNWEITDIHGAIIALGKDQFNDFNIDISNHPKGIYYLKITQGGLQTVSKLVLQ